MKYSFKIKDYGNNVKHLVVNVEDTSFNEFLNNFFEDDGTTFGKPLLKMIDEVKKGKKEVEYFSGNAFEVEIREDFSKISTDYPIKQLSECKIKTEDLYDVISSYLMEVEKC